MTNLSTSRRIKPSIVYTWRDWFMAFYFLALALSPLATIHEPQTLMIYSVSVLVISLIGFMSVLFKLKNVEAVMIVTIGLLFMLRALLLMPPDDIADNSNFIDFFGDVFENAPLANGIFAILPLTVLAVYRRRRGTISK